MLIVRINDFQIAIAGRKNRQKAIRKKLQGFGGQAIKHFQQYEQFAYSTLKQNPVNCE